jgi:TolB-like protein/cytochrome c-type biogenesis protein CcmH/NrfG
MQESGGSANPAIKGPPAPEPGQDFAAVSDVFISYASTDAAMANAVVAALESHGLKCWIAPRDVIPGSLYAEGIVRAINGARLLVLVLSESAVASPHVGKEIERASSKQRPIIALKTDAAALTPALEYFLSESQWVDVGVEGRENAVAKLVEAVRRRLLPASAGVRAAPPDRRTMDRAPATRKPWLAAAAASIVALALVYVLVDKLKASKQAANERTAATAAPAAAPAAAMVSDKSVAVLPFVDMSEKKDQAYFSDGLSEELIDMLAKVPDLRVPARTSSFYFKEQHATIAEIAKALGVAHILEGSVRRAGNTMRVTVQLIRADNGYHLWSETYDRDLKDVFKVQDDISRMVVEKLKLTLVNAVPSTPARIANPEVHNLYLQGRYFLQNETAGDLEKAIGFFQRAIAIDPNYAPAWGSLGYAEFRQVANANVPVLLGLEKANTAAQKAMELDPTLAEPYQVVSQVKMTGSHDWTGARAAINKALQVDPNNVIALIADAHLTRTVGNADDALAKFRQTLDRDPLNLLNRRYIARVLFFAGRLDEAEATVRQVLAMSPSFPAAHYELGRILLAKGQVAAAVSEFEAEKSGWREFGLPLGYQAERRTAEANAALAALVRDSAGSEFQVAETYAYFGNPDKAFYWLDRAVDHDPGIQWLRGDPLFKDIIADPRYAALLRKLNLPP